MCVCVAGNPGHGVQGAQVSCSIILVLASIITLGFTSADWYLALHSKGHDPSPTSQKATTQSPTSSRHAHGLPGLTAFLRKLHVPYYTPPVPHTTHQEHNIHALRPAIHDGPLYRSHSPRNLAMASGYAVIYTRHVTLLYCMACCQLGCGIGLSSGIIIICTSCQHFNYGMGPPKFYTAAMYMTAPPDSE